MDKKLQKGIVTVFIANMINVFFSLCTNFLLPKYLSVDSYAAIKTYQLYVSYVGLFHFGYVDGVYLRYGGKDITQENKNFLYSDIHTMHIFQVVVVIITFLIAILLKDIILVFFTLSILPLNMNNFYKFLYQATGEFKRYGNAMNVTTITVFLINMILLFAFSTDYYVIYLVGYIIVYALVWLYLEVGFQKVYGHSKSSFSFKDLVDYIQDGFLLTLGNLASILLTSMDRWFVKLLMDTLAFAQYSFAVSVENFLNLAITPITTTLYNYFCREGNNENRNKIIKYVIVFATLLPSAAFGVKFILEIFLTEYIDSTKIVFFLFGAQMFGVVIKGVFVNLYKVQRKQSTYFKKLCLVIIIGFITNYVFYSLVHQKESFAFATLISNFIWFIISGMDFKGLGINISVKFYLILQVIALIFCGYTFMAIPGFIIYIIFSLVMLVIFMRDTLEDLIIIFKNRILSIKR